MAQVELRFLLAGGTGEVSRAVKPADWLPDRSWNEILQLGALSRFEHFEHEFSHLYIDEFKRIFDSNEPHR